MKVKGGAAVDPDSGLAESASVWREGKDVFSVVLNAVDVQVSLRSLHVFTWHARQKILSSLADLLFASLFFPFRRGKTLFTSCKS